MHYGNMQVKQVHKKCIIFSLYEVNEVNKQILVCFEGHSKFSTFLLWRKWNKCAGTDNIKNMYSTKKKENLGQPMWVKTGSHRPRENRMTCKKKFYANKAKKVFSIK